MSDETPTPAPLNGRDAISAFLDQLVPPDGQTITDLEGRTYTLPSALSARRQIKAGRHIQGLLGTVAGVKGGASAVVAAAIDHAVQSDDALDALDRAFAEALPDVLATMRERASDPDAKPSDHFALEEIVAALVPYLLRAGRRVLQATGADKALAAFAA